MDYQKNVCWGIKTTYSIGIYFCEPVELYDRYVKRESVCAFDSAEKAEAWAIEIIECEGDMGFVFQKDFKYNRLNRIKNDKIYSVLFNKKQVCFTKTENIHCLIQSRGLNARYFKIRNNLNYQEARDTVFQYAKDTGHNSNQMRADAYMNRVYYR